MRTDERVTRMVFAAFVAAASVLLLTPGAAAQAGAPGNEDLNRQVERRFTVLPIVDGIVLTPRTAVAHVKSIEISHGTISVDGSPVTGAELREKLGADADTVLQASYLSAGDQRALAGVSAASPAPPAATPPPPLPSAQPDRSFDFSFPTRERGGDIIHFGRDVRVESGDVVHGNAVSIGRSVTVLGEVRGDVAAVGGDVELGPHAVVTGKVTAVGGRIHSDPDARVGGESQEINWSGERLGSLFRRSIERPEQTGWSFAAPLAVVVQITRAGVLILLAMLVVLIGGSYVDRVGSYAAAEPLKAGAVGFLAQILFIPLLIVTILLLVVTIIGIPLLVLIPFVILGLMLVALVGFTAVAGRVGRLIGARMSWTAGPYLLTAAGVFILLIPLLLARVIGLGGFPFSFLSFMLAAVGLIIEYVAWTVGFGAVALTRFSKAAP